ncbi:hypothetical protein [Lentzea aerocolonigenes]|uniref:hypothetical protein n=1 Tax=Lentzea aerocolonigenes TaxID=68170 RepID=UPI00068F0225|nr:hypothetical protein [Lentzea aerocolonigenes]MCP2245149.1 hydrophobic W protein [Lentzea aerocolonigenes]
MRSFSRAVKAALGTVGLVAALLGAVAAPANAEASGPARTVEEALRQAGGISEGIAADLPPEVVASANPSVCFSGHVQDIGWQPWECDDGGNLAYAGTEGQGLRLEALRVAPSGTGGVTCVQAHVQNVAWQKPVCVNDGRMAEIGTQAQSLRMEAFAFSSSTREVCAEAHMQNSGWLGEDCEPAGKTAVVGIVTLGLRMEALRGRIN